ncbi:MAG: excinuclease ABC subunit A [Rhodobacteraceae bacterium]|nr:excinuclease ABC subunit A [Paracoccaceae bacterium]
MTSEQKGLRFAAAVALIGFGLACALAAYPPLSPPTALLIDAVLWPFDGAQTLASSEARLLAAILGGITFGWGVMIWQLAGAPLARDPETIRPIILTAILAWFGLDSFASLLAGAPINLAANLVFLALFLVPMLRGRRTQPA